MRRLWIILAALLLGAPALACTTAVVSAGASADGRPMLWKQRDAPDPYNIIVHVKGGKFAYTALFPTQDSLHTRAYAGINEAGFGIMNNLSYNLGSDEVVQRTKAGPLMARALAGCRTLEDFEALLRDPSRPRPQSSNFGVIDAQGGAAYFEVSDTSFVRFDVPPGGILYRTNYSLTGDEGRGRGYERYATMGRLTDGRSRYEPEFFFEAGRRHLQHGADSLRSRRSGWMLEHDYIPRPTTTASIVIEGVAPGADEGSGMMWCATGYTPCAYPVAVWVAAGEDIPECLKGDANVLSVELSASVHSHPDHPKMVDVKQLRRIEKAVRRAQRREFHAARRLMRRGLTPESVRRYNACADRRFAGFGKGMAGRLKEAGR